MYIVTIKFTRPTTDIEFYTLKQSTEIPPELKKYFASTYVFSGKLITTDWTYSDDNLSATVMTIWNTKADFEEYVNDARMVSEYFPNRTAYHTENGITMEMISEEEL